MTAPATCVAPRSGPGSSTSSCSTASAVRACCTRTARSRTDRCCSAPGGGAKPRPRSRARSARRARAAPGTASTPTPASPSCGSTRAAPTKPRSWSRSIPTTSPPRCPRRDCTCCAASTTWRGRRSPAPGARWSATPCATRRCWPWRSRSRWPMATWRAPNRPRTSCRSSPTTRRARWCAPKPSSHAGACRPRHGELADATVALEAAARALADAQRPLRAASVRLELAEVLAASGDTPSAVLEARAAYTSTRRGSAPSGARIAPRP